MLKVRHLKTHIIGDKMKLSGNDSFFLLSFPRVRCESVLRGGSVVHAGVCSCCFWPTEGANLWDTEPQPALMFSWTGPTGSWRYSTHMLILCYALMEVQGIFWSERSNGVFVCAAGSSVGLQVGLVLTALLLFALGAALFVYLYKKRWGQISLCECFVLKSLGWFL